MRKMFLLACTTALAGAVAPARGGLFLNVDLAAQEIFFTGEDTGVPTVETVFGPFGFGNAFTLTFQDDFFPETPSDSVGVARGVNVGNNAFDGNLIEPSIVVNSDDSIVLLAEFTGGDETTLAGNGERISIADFSDATLQVLAEADGRVIPRFVSPLVSGDPVGFEELTVRVTVPEPASFALLGVAGLALAGRRRSALRRG